MLISTFSLNKLVADSLRNPQHHAVSNFTRSEMRQNGNDGILIYFLFSRHMVDFELEVFRPKLDICVTKEQHHNMALIIPQGHTLLTTLITGTLFPEVQTQS